jgi:hypothetical protein
VLAAEHLLRFDLLDFRVEPVEGARQIRGDVFTALRPLDKDADVVDLFPEAVAALEVFGEAALALKGFLRFGLVIPETGGRDLLFELR